MRKYFNRLVFLILEFRYALGVQKLQKIINVERADLELVYLMEYRNQLEGGEYNSYKKIGVCDDNSVSKFEEIESLIKNFLTVSDADASEVSSELVDKSETESKNYNFDFLKKRFPEFNEKIFVDYENFDKLWMEIREIFTDPTKKQTFCAVLKFFLEELDPKNILKFDQEVLIMPNNQRDNGDNFWYLIIPCQNAFLLLEYNGKGETNVIALGLRIVALADPESGIIFQVNDSNEVFVISGKSTISGPYKRVLHLFGNNKKGLDEESEKYDWSRVLNIIEQKLEGKTSGLDYLKKNYLDEKPQQKFENIFGPNRTNLKDRGQSSKSDVEPKPK